MRFNIPDQVWLQRLSEQLLEALGEYQWGRVRDVVTRLQVSALNGPQRRALAVLELRDMGITVPTSMLHLAIEAAVVWLEYPNGKPRNR